MNNFNYLFSLISERLPHAKKQEGINGPQVHIHEVHFPSTYLYRIQELKDIIEECREQFMDSTQTYVYEPIINIGTDNKYRFLSIVVRIRN